VRARGARRTAAGACSRRQPRAPGEITVQGEARGDVVGDRPLPHDRVAHALDHSRLAPFRREPRRTRLNDEPRPPGLLHVAEVAIGDRRSAVGNELDESLADEPRERLAERRPRDPELLRERLLSQACPWRKLARDDSFEELGVHLVDDALDLELAFHDLAA
jgi:hypothetical protein